MLSTDLVPVHNDIWRRLPFSSWRDFKPYHKPLLWRRQCLKGLNTDPEVFLSTFLPPVWHGKPQVFSYTQPPLHWSDHFYLSLPGVLEQYQGFGSMSSVAIEVVSAPLHFLHKEGSNNPRVYLDTDTGISFIWPAPRDKTGGGGTPALNTCLPLPFSTQWDGELLLPKNDKIMGATKCSNAYGMMAVVVKVCV